VALVLAPLVVGALGVVIERTMLRKLYKLDHLYGLLLTFGLALIIEGVFRNYFGVSGDPTDPRRQLQGGVNLGFMFLPIYRGWVVVASLAVCLATWYVIERTKLGAYLRAATENPSWCRPWASTCRCMITPPTGRRGAGGLRRRAGGAGLPGEPGDGVQPDHRRVRRRGDRRHGLDPGLHRHRLGLGLSRA
jgi:hypothetical protein